MKHLKRKAIARSWPLPKKGTKYVMKPYPGKKRELSLPLGIILRDILKIASTRREIKALLNANEIFVDGKLRKKEKTPLSLFDILSIPRLNKYYRITINEKRKIALEEINEKDSNIKICKVIGKKMLKNGIQQINCSDGINFIYKDKISINDSIIFDLKNKKIIKILPLKIGAEVFITGGAQSGLKGKIAEIDGKIKVRIKNKNLEVQVKNLYVIEK